MFELNTVMWNIQLPVSESKWEKLQVYVKSQNYGLGDRDK